MTLEYSLGIEDLVAFARYHFLSSRSVQRTKTLVQWGGAYSILLPLIIGAFTFQWAPLLIGGIVGSIFWAVVYPIAFDKILVKKARKTLEEYKGHESLGWRSVTITDDGILEKTELGERVTKWNAVDRIVITKSHTFIYIAPIIVHVIPRATIFKGHYGRFVTAVKSQLRRS